MLPVDDEAKHLDNVCSAGPLPRLLSPALGNELAQVARAPFWDFGPLPFHADSVHHLLAVESRKAAGGGGGGGAPSANTCFLVRQSMLKSKAALGGACALTMCKDLGRLRHHGLQDMQRGVIQIMRCATLRVSCVHGDIEAACRTW